MDGMVILGCGTMGEAIVGGLRAAAAEDSEPLPEVRAVTVRSAERAAYLTERYGLRALTSSAEALEGADIALLAVKPGSVAEVLDAPGVSEALADKLLISLCAGVTTRQLVQWAPASAIVRAMPNTPCLIREGMTVLSPGPRAERVHLDTAARIFGSVGRCRILDEKHLDAVTGLSGSGPAFACVILEALADGGVRMGLPRDVAIELAAQAFQGAAQMVLQTGRHPAALKDEVTTPAGCTIAGLLTMEDGRIRSTLARTVEEATRTASSLGQERT